MLENMPKIEIRVHERLLKTTHSSLYRYGYGPKISVCKSKMDYKADIGFICYKHIVVWPLEEQAFDT